MAKEFVIDGKNFISARRARELTRYTTDYIGQLCRAGKVEARMIGRSWYVEEESITNHLKSKSKIEVSSVAEISSIGSVAEIYVGGVTEEKLHSATDVVAEEKSEEILGARQDVVSSSVAPEVVEAVKTRSFENFQTSTSKSSIFSYENDSENSLIPELKKSSNFASAIDEVVSRKEVSKAVQSGFVLSPISIEKLAQNAVDLADQISDTKPEDVFKSFSNNFLQKGVALVLSLSLVLGSAAMSERTVAEGVAQKARSAQIALAHDVAKVTDLASDSLFNFGRGVTLASLSSAFDSFTKSFTKETPAKNVAADLNSSKNSSGSKIVLLGQAGQCLVPTSAPVAQATAKQVATTNQAAAKNTTSIVYVGTPATVTKVVGGVSPEELDLRLNQLSNKVYSEISRFTASSDSKYSPVQTLYTLSAPTNKIDQLHNTLIVNPTIQGGTIDGATISGGTFSGTVTGLLALSSTSSTSTIAGGLSVSGGLISPTLLNCGKVYTDVNGNFTCGVDAGAGVSPWTETGGIISMVTPTNATVVGGSTQISSAMLSVVATSTNSKALALREALGQVVDIFSIEDSTGSNLVSVDAVGRALFAHGASSTNFSVFNNLLVGGNATTTIQGSVTGTSTIQGQIAVLGTNSTSTFAGGLEASSINITSTISTSTFANGINLTGGCFSVGGSCISGGGGGGTPGGLNTYVQFNNSGSFAGDSSFAFNNTTKVLSLQSLLVTSSTTLQNFTFANATGTNATTTTLFANTLGVGADYITDITGAGLSVVGGALTINTAGDWTGTFDGQEGTYYLNAANLANFGTPFYNFFHATTSDGLAEGVTNQYYTSAKVDSRINATTSIDTLLKLLHLTNASTTQLTAGSIYGFNLLGDIVGNNNNISGLTLLSASNILSAGSSTIQNLTTINSTSTNATTTNLAVTGAATSTFVGGIQTAALSVTGSASSTFANGINLSTGCFAVGGTCLSTGGSAAAVGGTGAVQFANGTSFAGDTNTFFWDNATKRLGIGTSSPYAMLSVAGEVVGQNFTSTSTTALNTFPNLFSIYSTSTSATSTNFFATTASSTNLFATSASVGTLSVSGAATSTFGGGVDVTRIKTSATSTLAGLQIATGGLTISTMNCTGLANGGKLYTDTAGNILCGNDIGGGAGGLTSLNGLADATQTFSRTNDTNVTLSITSAAGDHNFAIGWTGTLADSRVADNLTISGGVIDGTPIGATTPSTGVFTNSTSTNATSTTFFATTASSTNLFSSSASFGVLTVTGNATSSFASTLSVGSTTPSGNSLLSIGTSSPLLVVDKISGFAGISTSTPGSIFSIGNIANFTTATSTIYTGLQTSGSLNVTGSASSTFTNGINLSSGCFAIGSTCVGGSNLTGSGSTGQATFWTGTGSQSGDNNFFWDNTNKRLGISSTSPYAKLAVAGNIVADNIIATSTTATSTFAGSLSIGSTTPAGNSLLSVGTSSPLFVVDKISGNVGIGTSNPTSKLQVSGGSIKIDSGTGIYSTGLGGTNSFLVNADGYAAVLNLVAGQFLIYDGGGNIRFVFNQDGTLRTTPNSTATGLSVTQAGTGNLATFVGTGSVAVGTTSPWAKFSVQNTYGSLTSLFDVATTTSSGNATTSIFMVHPNGNVGIGTTSPYAKLSVVGEVVAPFYTATSTTATSSIINTLSIGSTTPSGNSLLSVGTSSPLFMVDKISGFVGVGSATPSYSLDVNGTARASTLIGSSLVLTSSSTAYSTLSSFGGFNGYISASGGIGTGGSDSTLNAQRITAQGNLTNIGSIQAGELNLTSGGTFATNVDYTAGTTPHGVAMGDLNGDGKIDMVVTNNGGSTASVFINNGSGTFATKVDYTTGSTPYGVAIGDLNGDGKADLAVANGSGTGLSILINNGNGTFATKVDYATGVNPRDVVIGDVNGDGKPDLVLANSGDDTISVFINKGSGTFLARVNYGMGQHPTGVAVGDVTGDGRADLVVSNTNDNNISVLRNNGNGTFATAVNYTSGTGPLGVAIGDFNGDGKADIVSANNGSTNASVFINNGSGTFASAVNYTAGTNPYYVAVGDVNGDGKIDMVVSNNGSTNASVFINNVSGTFASAVNYTTGSSARGIALGDVNGDGKVDIATANAGGTSASVILNTPATTLFAQGSSGSVAVGTSSPWAKFSIQNTYGSLLSLFDVATTTSAGNATTSLFMVHSNGNVGIGTTSPYAKLSVVGEVVAPFYTATSTTATSTFMGSLSIGSTTPVGSSLFVVGTSSPLFIVDKTSGFVGIGTSTPGSIFSIGGVANFTTATSTIYSGIQTSGSLNVKGTASSTFSNGISIASGCFAIGSTCVGGDNHTGTGSSGQATFWTGTGSQSGDNNFTWDNTNKRLGIASTTPYATLAVGGNIVADNIIATSTTATSTFAGSLSIGSTTPAGNTLFSIGTSSPLFVADKISGFVGVGTSSPFALFSVAGQAAASYFTSFSTTATSSFLNTLSIGSTTPIGSSLFAVGTSSPLFYVDKVSGKVAIGTTSPYAKLSVTGEVAGDIFTASATTSTSTLSGGLSVGQGGLTYNFSTGETEIANLITGTASFDDDAGVVQWTNLPIVNAVNGAIESYTANMGGDPMLTVYGESNGSGGAKNTAVSIGTTTPYSRFTIWGRGTGASTTLEVVNNASTSLFNIIDSGNIGIGTTSPYAKLSVVGLVLADNFVATSTTATSTFANTLAIGTSTPPGNSLFSVGTSSPLFHIDKISGKIGVGTAAPTAALHVVGPASTGTNAAAINAITATGGTGNGSGAGGAFSFTGGTGGTTGAGGAFTVNGGNAGASGGTGGAISFTSGSASGSQNSGAMTIATANIGSGNTGTAGAINITGGSGTTAGVGSTITITGGSATGGSSSLTLVGAGTATAGTATLTSGAGSGSGLNGGLLSLTTGTGGANANGGAISMSTGAGNGTGAGGNISITAGGGGVTNANGGNVTLNGGASTGAGTTGNVLLATVRGNVGIGTTSPYAKLSVTGEVVANNFTATSTTATSSFMNTISVGSTTPDGNLLFAVGTSSSLFSIDKISGFVGVATSSPFALFSVAGQAAASYFTSFSTTATSSFLNTLSIGSTTPVGSSLFAVGTSTPNLVVDKISGKVGMGTSSPSEVLTVRGNARGNMAAFYDNLGKNMFKFGTDTSGPSGAIMSMYNSAGSVFAQFAAQNVIGPKLFIDASDVSKADVSNAYGAAIDIKVPFTVGQENGILFNNSGTSDLTLAGITAYTSSTFVPSIGGLKFKTNALGNGSGGSTKMVIDPEGNIAMGTSTTNVSSSLFLQGASTTIPVFTIASSTGQSLFTFNRDGNFGIGSTSPYAKLSVAGLVVADNFVATSTTATSSFAGTLSIGSTTPIGSSLFAVGTSSPLFYIDKVSGNVAIGTTSPYAKLSVTGEVAADKFTASATTSTSTLSGGLSVGQGGLTYNFSTGETEIANLITGTASFDDDAGVVQWADLPITSSATGTIQSYSATLDQNPMLTIYGKSNGSGSAIDTGVAIGTSTAYSRFTVWGRGTGASSTLEVVNNASTSIFNILDSGNVGIGTTSPYATLSVVGQVVAPFYTATSTTATSSMMGVLSIGSTTPAGNLLLSVGTSSQRFVVDKTSGMVGVGTSTPWRTLSVTGTVAMDGLNTVSGTNGDALCLSAGKEVLVNVGATNCLASSLRFKHGVTDLASGLSEINQMHPVSYLSNYNNEERVGFIAEEMMNVDPRLVFYEADGATVRGVRYEEITPVLAKAVQELDARVIALEAASTTQANLAQPNTSTVTWLKDTLASFGIFVSDFAAHITHLVADSLTVGSAAAPAGITMFDKATNAPYCLSIVNGVTETTSGECVPYVAPAVTYVAPADPAVTSPVDPATATSTTPVVDPTATSTVPVAPPTVSAVVDPALTSGSIVP